MSQEPLKLNEAIFWDDEFDDSEAVGALCKRNFLGVAIDAPAFVPLSTRTEAPVFGYYRRSLRENVAVNLSAQTIGVAVRLDSNRVIVGQPLKSDKEPAPVPPPNGDPGDGFILSAFRADLRSTMPLPWEPAKYRVTLLCREHLSNPVTIELGRPAGDFQDPEVLKFLEEQRKKEPLPLPAEVYPPKGAEAGKLPDYSKRPDSPPVPAKSGIEFALDRVVVAKPDGTCKVVGSFRLPVLPREKVFPRGSATTPPAVGDPKATAVIPITLAITGSDKCGPWVIRLAVPVYDPVPPGLEPAEATGHFAVDLFQIEAFPRTPMTYFLTAFNGEVASGPKAVGVLTPDMLPKGS